MTSALMLASALIGGVVAIGVELIRSRVQKGKMGAEAADAYAEAAQKFALAGREVAALVEPLRRRADDLETQLVASTRQAGELEAQLLAANLELNGLRREVQVLREELDQARGAARTLAQEKRDSEA